MVAGFAGQTPDALIGIDASAQAGGDARAGGAHRRRTADLIDVGRDLRDDEIVLDDRYHAGTYGIPDELTLEAMRAARLEGMITDPVYEGKSMAGLIDLVNRGEIEKGAKSLRAPRRPARAQRLRGPLPLRADTWCVLHRRRSMASDFAATWRPLRACSTPIVRIRSLMTESERPLYHGHDGAREWLDGWWWRVSRLAPAAAGRVLRQGWCRFSTSRPRASEAALRSTRPIGWGRA